MKEIDYKDKLKGSLYAFAIGDAMGATCEFMEKEEIKREFGRVNNIIGGGWLNLKKGEVTDDTMMSICIMDALMKEGSCNFEKNVMDNFIKWFNGKPKDIGNQCRRTLTIYKETGKLIGTDNEALGNGSLMRALPCALLNSTNSLKLNIIQRRLTHNNIVCDEIIKNYTNLLKGILKGEDFDFSNIKLLKATGHIKNTYNNALYWFNKNSVEKCIIGAVNDGGDADTIAAIAASLIGAKYGYSSLPKQWVIDLSSNVKEKLDEFLDYLL